MNQSRGRSRLIALTERLQNSRHEGDVVGMEPLKKTLILFTRNEIDGIQAVFPQIPLGSFDQVFAIDGWSRDGTVEYLQERGVTVYSQERVGRVNALLEAMRYTTGEIVVFLSADGNENPRDIPQLLELIAKHDLVLTSRFLPGGASDDTDDPLHLRKTVNILLGRLVGWIWGAKVTDVTNGLRAIRGSLWQKMRISPGYHSAELQIAIQALKLRSKVAEIPTQEHKRLGPRRQASTLRMALSLSKVFLKELVA